MVGYRQLTREAEAALEKSERAYLVHYQTLVKEYLEDDLGCEVIDLTAEYSPEENRAEAYERMAEEVFTGAEEVDGPVSFALYGHPMVFVSPARWVFRDAEERGFEAKVIPGISSMDAIYADIGLDPAANGIQMFEATDLLVREFDLNPDIPAMIWQIGSVETALHTVSESTGDRFTNIREYLQQFYPDDHTAYLLQTATYPVGESKQIEFTLDEFEDMSDQINFIQTLYLPAVRERPPQNEELLERLTSSDHLEVITSDEETVTTESN